jgi:serine/threonine-protein kinase RsbW
MLIEMELTLPRDARFVAIMRNVAQCILTDLEVPEAAVEDVEVAVTEACANAVRHAVDTAEYSVSLRVAGDGCHIDVVDVGPGFDPLGDELDGFDLAAEEGRGLYLMRSIVDDVTFARVDGRTRVRLTKRWPSRHDDIERSTGAPGAAGERQRSAWSSNTSP